MAAISRNLEQSSPNSSLHMCLQNIIGISAKLRALGLGERFDNTVDLIAAAAASTKSTAKYMCLKRNVYAPYLYCGFHYLRDKDSFLSILHTLCHFYTRYFVHLFKLRITLNV